MALTPLTPAFRNAAFSIVTGRVGEPIPTLDGLGASLLNHWEVPESGSPLITLNGSNVSELDDRAGRDNAEQSTPANQPLYHANGGPNNKPYIELQDTGRKMAAAIDLAAGHRVGLYAVIRRPAASSGTQTVCGIGTSAQHRTQFYSTTTELGAQSLFTSGTLNQIITYDLNDEWMLVATRPLDTGALHQINGTRTVNNFTGTAGLEAADEFHIGSRSGASASSGDFAFAVLVDDPTDEKDEIVRNYVAYHYGLDVTPKLDNLGSDLLHHWEVPASGSPLIMLNGGNVSQLDDRVATAHATQATAANQLAYHASGGPDDKPYIECQDDFRTLVANISIAAGNRVGLYAVAAYGGGTVSRVVIETRGPGGIVMRQEQSSGPGFRPRAGFTGGLQSLSVSSPAFDTNWHLFATRPLSTGALSQIDGVTTTPNYTGTDTLAEASAFAIGSSSLATGKFAFAVLVDDPTDAKDAIVRDYVRYHYGLSV